MKIIKGGKLPTIQKACKYCECEFEFDLREVYVSSGGSPSEVQCPCCSKDLRLTREEEIKLNINKTYEH